MIIAMVGILLLGLLLCLDVVVMIMLGIITIIEMIVLIRIAIFDHAWMSS